MEIFEQAIFYNCQFIANLFFQDGFVSFASDEILLKRILSKKLKLIQNVIKSLC